MAVMQCAHRRHKPDGDAFPEESLAPCSHGSRGANNLHEPGGGLQAGRDP